jgi:hypothetical protein
VVVIDPTWETMASNIISQSTGAITKLSAFVKICKYKGFHERHHFILMAMELHGTPKHDMNCLCPPFHHKQSRGHLFLSFYIQFFKRHVSIAFQHALASTIERKIA